MPKPVIQTATDSLASTSPLTASFSPSQAAICFFALK